MNITHVIFVLFVPRGLTPGSASKTTIVVLMVFEDVEGMGRVKVIMAISIYGLEEVVRNVYKAYRIKVPKTRKAALGII